MDHQAPDPAAKSAREDIPALIRDLGDPSFEKRTAATRALCAIGAQAVPALQQAAQSRDFEVARRAQETLLVIEQLFFSGVEIRIAASRERIAWNEPLHLTIELRNTLDVPTGVPIRTDPSAPPERSVDARQVAAMFDVADWLVVTGPGDRKIELRVDDMYEDPDVEQVIRERTEESPSTMLAPRDAAKVTIPELNRGYARFPFLDAGDYEITLDYVPPWDDEVLARERAGRVTSNTVRVRVTEGAPEPVSRAGSEARVEVGVAGSRLVARITNRWDLPIVINRNFGATAPFAHGEWVFVAGGGTLDTPVEGGGATRLAEFSPDRLTVLPPGQSVVVAEIAVAELRRAVANAPHVSPEPGAVVQFSYLNRTNRAWHRRQGESLMGDPGTPAVLRTPLPRRMLTSRYLSNAVEWSSLPE